MYRTNNFGVNTPHETPPMRQNPASVDIVTLGSESNSAFSGNEEAELGKSRI